MERKQLEDLIQRLWDQGASIEIMNILEHDKQQREALARVEVERDNARCVVADLLLDRDAERQEAQGAFRIIQL